LPAHATLHRPAPRYTHLLPGTLLPSTRLPALSHCLRTPRAATLRLAERRARALNTPALYANGYAHLQHTAPVHATTLQRAHCSATTADPSCSVLHTDYLPVLLLFHPLVDAYLCLYSAWACLPSAGTFAYYPLPCCHYIPCTCSYLHAHACLVPAQTLCLLHPFVPSPAGQLCSFTFPLLPLQLLLYTPSVLYACSVVTTLGFCDIYTYLIPTLC